MDVPEGWRCCSVEETLEGHTPGFWGSAPFGDGGNVLVLRSTNFRADGRLTYRTAAARLFPEGKLATKKLVPGDILLERSGGGPKTPVGRVCLFDAEPGIYSFSNFMGRLRPDPKTMNAKFLFYRLWQLHADGTTATLQQATTGIRNLAFKDYLKQHLAVPPLAEQKKIAEILGSVDEAIQATQAVIDQTRKVKQGLLQQLLTRGIGHTRFKQTEIGEIPESWEVVLLEDVLEDITYGLTVRPKYVDEGVPLVSAKETREGRLDIDSAKRISFDDFSKLRSRSIPRGGEILVTKTGTIGRTAYIHPDVLPIAISQNVALLRPIAERMNGRFLERIFQSPGMKGLMQRSAKVLSVLDLQLGTMRQFCVPVPSLDEQSEICTRVAAVDAALGDASRTLDSQIRLKHGLMSDLLSGRVRVKVNA